MSRKNSHLILVAVSAFVLSSVLSARADVKTYNGTFADGATYIIQVPSNWNGTLVLYSHGYVPPGGNNSASDVGDPLTGNYLLGNGYALGGSSYATTGWAIHEALPDQIEVLNTFKTLVGKPSRTIAWGHSLGGIITAGLVQKYPTRFDAAMPMCGVVAGAVGTWNQALDTAFAFYTLLGQGSGLQLVDITNPTKNLTTAETILATAQNSAKGRARIALAAALADTPGWFDPLSPEPSPTDYSTLESNQYTWMADVDFPFAFDYRAELESRAGGNPSWNNKVKYKDQFKNSVDHAEVKALYEEAGLDLDADLATLNAAARIKVNPASLRYLKRNIIFNGNIGVPVLTLHTKGDGLVQVQEESAYKDVVDAAGNDALLQQVYVHRAGHCQFTPAETIVAFQALINRLDTGKWSGLGSKALNNAATGLGSTYNVLLVNGQEVSVPPAYFKFSPAVFLREYDSRN